MEKEYRLWFESASGNLAGAESLVLSKDYVQASEQLGQAVEKLVKGYASYLGLAVVNSHSIPSLINTIAKKDKSVEVYRKLARLSKNIYHTRYPDSDVQAGHDREDIKGFGEEEFTIDFLSRVRDMYSELCFKVGY